MGGADERMGSMFSYVSLEERVPANHPLRAVRRITDRAPPFRRGVDSRGHRALALRRAFHVDSTLLEAWAHFAREARYAARGPVRHDRPLRQCDRRRTTRHAGYDVSERKRKRVEQDSNA